MKTEILCIGDSITEGITGSSYIRILKEKLGEESYNIHNHGLGGDTLIGVKNRLESLLLKGEEFDVIVFEAGHNDIALPYFAKNDPSWREGLEMLKLQGVIPIPDSDEFEHKLKEVLEFIKENHQGMVIITTLSCLGEDLKSILNNQRDAFNEIIRRMAKEYECKLADVGKVFDRELEDKQDEVIDRELWRTFLNPPSTSLTGDEDAGKKFFLTIDGVHVNEKGAEIYAREIKRYLQER